MLQQNICKLENVSKILISDHIYISFTTVTSSWLKCDTSKCVSAQLVDTKRSPVSLLTLLKLLDAIQRDRKSHTSRCENDLLQT